MAILGNIRKHSGLVVTLVGVAIGAFVIGDIGLKSWRNQTNVGNIDGEEITYKEFEQKVETNTELTKQGMGKDNLTAEEVFTVRQNTWNQLVNEVIMQKQYETLGLTISEEEITDLIQGPNPHRFIIQNFTNPETNQFDHNLLVNFLQTIDQREASVQKQMENLIVMIKADRLNQKYNNLIGKGYYMPKALVNKDYQMKNIKAQFRMVSQSFSMIGDSAVKVTDADLKAYYDKNINLYDQTESRDIDYVVFDVTPSQEDRVAMAKEMDKLYQEMSTTNDLSAFINFNSDKPYDSTFLKKGTLPVQIDSLMFASEPGTMAGPWVDNDIYHIARLVDKQSRPDSLKASHILIAFKGAYGAAETVKRSREEAVALADSLLAATKKNQKDFATLAARFSNDPSAAKNSGDLGWFADGQMVPQFNKAVLDNPVGSVVKVETPFGFHVINITGKTKSIEKVRVAVLNREIAPSNATIQQVYAKASAFAGQNHDQASFDKAVTDQGLNKRTKEYINPMDQQIPGLKSPREIIRWAFNPETTVGMVSEVKDVDGSFVVAVVKNTRSKGIAPFEQVKEMIQPTVLKEKKIEALAEKMGKINAKTIDELAAGLQAKVDTIRDINFMSFNIPMIGREPALLGTIFSMNAREISKPIKGTNFAMVVVVDQFTDAPARDNLSVEKKQLEGTFNSRVANNLFRILEKETKIEDNRVLFY